MGQELVVEVGGQEEDTKRYTFAVVEATVGSSLERSIFRRHAERYLEKVKENGLKPTSLSVLNITLLAIYPDLMSLTQMITVETLDDDGEIVKTENPEFTPAEFREIRDSITTPWSDLVYTLNPHWLPQTVDEELDEEEVGKEKKNDD